MPFRSIVVIASFLGISLALDGCTPRQRIKAETEVAKALISTEQEKALGMRVHQQLEEQEVRFLDDPAVNTYVKNLAAQIFAEAEEDRPKVEWHAHVVEDRETVNAFATPGGHIYVTTGLLLEADNAAEVAGVLAHEAGHVSARHSARQMVSALGLNTVAALALGEDPSMLQQVAANIAGTGLMLAHSRADETEADRYGVRYAAEAGYDPAGLVSFFEKLKEKQGEIPRALTFLMTHPAPAERIEDVKSLIRRQDRSGGRQGTEIHQAIRNRLERIAPPPRPEARRPGSYGG